MNREHLIKDITNINDDFAINDKYDDFYKNILNKKELELNTSDVYFLLRQNLLETIAFKQAILIIRDNPLAGEMYEGQLLEIISEKIEKLGKTFKIELVNLAKELSNKIETLTWDDDFEKEEFLNIYINFSKKVDEL